jgi:hypothetical protein
VPEEAPTIVMRTNWTPRDQERSFELAFDIAGAQEVVPKSHFTTLIQHKFRYEGFKSRTQFDAVIDKNAVVFHSCKDGSIYQYLRQNLSGGVDKSQETRWQNGKDIPEATPLSTTGHSREASLVEAQRAEYQEATGSRTQSSEGSVSPDQTVVSKTFKPELESVIAQNAVIRNGLPAMSPPWENKEDTERDVKMLCEVLALFAKAPLYKSRVRQALREAKIIK